MSQSSMSASAISSLAITPNIKIFSPHSSISHKFSEDGKLSKEYILPSKSYQTFMEAMSDPIFWCQSHEIESYSDKVHVSETFTTSQHLPQHEQNLFQTLPITVSELDLYLHHLPIIIEENAVLEECWKSYEKVHMEGKQNMISDMVLLKQACDKSVRKFLLLNDKLQDIYYRFERMKDEFSQRAEINRSLATELQQQIDGKGVDKLTQRKLSIAQEEERLANLIDTHILSNRTLP